MDASFKNILTPLIILIIFKTLQFFHGCATFQDPRFYDGGKRESFLRNHEYFYEKGGFEKMLMMDAMGVHFLQSMRLPKKEDDIGALPFGFQILRGSGWLITLYVGLIAIFKKFPALSGFGVMMFGKTFYNVVRFIASIMIIRAVFAMYYSKKEIDLYKETLDEATIYKLSTMEHLSDDPQVAKAIENMTKKGSIAYWMMTKVKFILGDTFKKATSLVDKQDVIKKTKEKFSGTLEDNIKHAFAYNKYGGDACVFIVILYYVVRLAAPLYAGIFNPLEADNMTWHVAFSMIIMLVITIFYTLVGAMIWVTGRSMMSEWAASLTSGTPGAFFMSWILNGAYDNIFMKNDLTFEWVFNGWIKIVLQPTIAAFVCAFFVVLIFMVWNEKKIKMNEEAAEERGDYSYEPIPPRNRIITYTFLGGIVFLVIAVIAAGMWLLNPRDVSGLTSLMWNFVIALAVTSFLTIMLMR